MKKVIDIIKEDTRRLLKDFTEPKLPSILKFYEILVEMHETSISKNKREIYYQSVKIFKNQRCIDRLVDRMAQKFCLSASDLLITASLKGLIHGNIIFKQGGADLVRPNLIPDQKGVTEIITPCSKIVVIEKDSLFSLICQQTAKHAILQNVLFVCGKGYPDNNTMYFLKRMEGKVEIFGLFDYDPFGMHIYCVYKYGSKKNTGVLSMQRIGMCSDDVFKYKIDENELLKLNVHDYKKLESLVKFDDDMLHRDIQFLKNVDRKMEMEIFTGRGSSFIMTYLCDKIF
ncbi:hypothetical protein EDEG_02480 [Edhazardia aedis USNM 41457]|uniref:DNA topoisomerase (ATP-hydrolyzing) n=1 Tax=Edhazardia aedis (strain USNM 41457) TaxID=1003232 RepID=J9DKQ7_EDHAE|nr:hypothetical protein EDEG_02480 [Edhazardia aedis USNM 41457]|eukprot:EJW03175.1 hypothetical protein EDEG_02480 [Edhazardia aedis USNM 41457]